MINQTVVLSVATDGSEPLHYRWFRNGVPLGGETGASVVLTAVQPSAAGDYAVEVSNAAGSATSPPARLEILFPANPGPDAAAGPSPVPARLRNLSLRALAGAGGRTLIAGFVVSGESPRQVLLRGIGPGLARLNVTGALATPRLKLFHGDRLVAENAAWQTGAANLPEIAARLGAFPLAAGQPDAAMVLELGAGAYAAHVDSVGGETGVALVELYDADIDSPAGAHIVNLSGRGFVGAGDELLIAGFVIQGAGRMNVLIRGAGPALTGQGVAEALPDPLLELFHHGDVLARNDDWNVAENAPLVATAAARVGAFAFPPDSKDAAVLVSLPEGVYTAHLTGMREGSGIGLLEVYEVLDPAIGGSRRVAAVVPSN